MDVTLTVPGPGFGALTVEIDIAKLDFGKLNLWPPDCRVANTAAAPHPFPATRSGELCEP